MLAIKRAILACILTAVAAIGLRAQITPPAAPDIIRVTVDTATGMASIRWDPSPSSDVEKYTVYYYIPGIEGALAVDTVSGETREYTYTDLDPSVSSQTLTVAAVDSSGNGGVLPDPPHRTMFLTTTYDSCSRAMKLEWTSYQGWDDDLVRYEVYFKLDGGTYGFLDQAPPEETTELHLDIEDNHSYCYFIKAIKNDNTISYSNIACRNVTHPLYPAWINAESASAIGKDQVEVKFAVDPAGEVTSFQLYKSYGPGKQFEQVTTLRNVSDSLIHLDPVISTELRYQYKLYALDVCDNINPETESNICGNIVLEATSVAMEGFLNWHPYLEFEAGVKNYLIYREINRAGFELIPGGITTDTSCQDDLSFVSQQQIEDKICYRVLAEENDSYTRGNKGFSWSNVSCIFVVPEILMANAFTPNDDGTNDVIAPILTFIPRQYVFQVFDRWGSKVFETQDHTIPWDGRNNGGKKVPEGVYVYYILLTTSSGIEVQKKGVITVFYP